MIWYIFKIVLDYLGVGFGVASLDVHFAARSEAASASQRPSDFLFMVLFFPIVILIRLGMVGHAILTHYLKFIQLVPDEHELGNMIAKGPDTMVLADGSARLCKCGYGIDRSIKQGGGRECASCSRDLAEQLQVYIP